VRSPPHVRRITGIAAGVAVAILLGACAEAPRTPGREVEFAPADEPFAVDGRLSARQGTNAITANFSWKHHPPKDELSVATPLGQAVAELEGDTAIGRVEVRTADGRRDEAADWTTLTERALGYRLPITGLAAWIRAVPLPDTPYTVEADAEGRVTLLRQAGWEIVYDYADASARRPMRYRITYPDLEIRMVIDAWR
jgi:outer membrane lipoprotein LolB